MKAGRLPGVLCFWTRPQAQTAFEEVKEQIAYRDDYGAIEIRRPTWEGISA